MPIAMVLPTRNVAKLARVVEATAFIEVIESFVQTNLKRKSLSQIFY